jgi:hypothetical protein
LNLSFREFHGAEKFSLQPARLFRILLAARFLMLVLRLNLAQRRFLMEIGLFLVVRFGGMRRVFARAALRFIVAGLAESLRLARRLDAAQRAAQFINFPFVREFLPLGHFDEFEHFIEMVNHLFQTLGDFRRVLHGLTDGRGVGGAKIGIARARCPLFGSRRTFKTFSAFGALATVRAIRSLRPLGHESLGCGPNIFATFTGTF